jgi:Na+-transporting methylmalonyl-CoA/oxaloacetate decarboxylase gamma subunit
MKETLTYGLLITVLGYSVTLLTLALLYLAFRYLPNVLHWHFRFRMKKQGHSVDSSLAEHRIPADVNAAIAAALHLYFNELHDNLDTRLTIKKIDKVYSPWSARIFGMNNKLHK